MAKAMSMIPKYFLGTDFPVDLAGSIVYYILLPERVN